MLTITHITYVAYDIYFRSLWKLRNLLRIVPLINGPTGLSILVWQTPKLNLLTISLSVPEFVSGSFLLLFPPFSHGLLEINEIVTRRKKGKQKESESKENRDSAKPYLGS